MEGDLEAAEAELQQVRDAGKQQVSLSPPPALLFVVCVGGCLCTGSDEPASCCACIMSVLKAT